MKQLETETDSNNLSRLGEALGSLSVKLEAKDVQPRTAVIMRRMETYPAGFNLVQLGEALGSLSVKQEAGRRLNLYVELLNQPWTVGNTRDRLLKELDKSGVFGEKLYDGIDKDLDIWKFVDWANDPARGGKYHLDLSRKPSSVK